MKILSNKNGIALIILLAAIVFIAALGAGLVSLVGSKHTGFLYQNNSYHALNAANGGVEYAIRYISDNLKDTSKNYFQNPLLFQNASSPVTIGVSGDESFSYSYDYGSDVLAVSGFHKNSQQQIKIHNFRQYMDPLTFQYDPTIPLVNKSPTYSVGPSNVYIIIPLINNINSNMTILGFALEMPSWSPGSSVRYLKRFYFTQGTLETQLYNYQTDVSFATCGNAPCRDTNGWWGSDVGIRITSGMTSFNFNMNLPYVLSARSTGICKIAFEPDPFTGKRYSFIVRYRISGDTADRTTALQFVL